MSNVPKEAQKRGRLKAEVECRRLTKHTLQIIKNNKVFRAMPTGDEEEDAKNPPQPELVGKIRDTILDAYMAAFSANETYFNKQNYRHRRQLQDKSIAKLNELLALEELCITVFHLPLKRAGYWASQIVYVRNLIQAWKESDYQRYRKI